MRVCACECVYLSMLCVCQAREILPDVAGSLILNFFHCESFLPTVQGCFFHTAPTQTRGTRLAQRGDSSIACRGTMSMCVCVCRLPVLSFLFLGNRRNRKLSKQLEAFAFTHRHCSLSLWLYVCLNIYIYEYIHRCMHNIRLKFVNKATAKANRGSHVIDTCLTAILRRRICAI